MRVLEGEFREGDLVQVDAGPGGLQFAKQQAGAVRRRPIAARIRQTPNPRGERRSVPRRPSGTMWYGLAFLFLLVLAQTYFLVPAGRQIPYSEFKSLVAQGKVAEATVGEQIIRGTLKPVDANAKPEPFVTTRIEDPSLVGRAREGRRQVHRRADEPVAARAVELDHSPAAPGRRSGASSSGRWAAPKAA